MYISSDTGDDFVMKAKEVVSAGVSNMQAEVIYCPARYQGDVWKLVLDAEAVNVITKRLPFHLVVHVAEKVMGEKELEREIAREERRPVRSERDMTPPSSQDPRKPIQLYPGSGVLDLEKEAARQQEDEDIVDDLRVDVSFGQDNQVCPTLCC